MGTKALSFDIYIVHNEVIFHNTVSFYFLSSSQLTETRLYSVICYF